MSRVAPGLPGKIRFLAISKLNRVQTVGGDPKLPPIRRADILITRIRYALCLAGSYTPFANATNANTDTEIIFLTTFANTEVTISTSISMLRLRIDVVWGMCVSATLLSHQTTYHTYDTCANVVSIGRYGSWFSCVQYNADGRSMGGCRTFPLCCGMACRGGLIYESCLCLCCVLRVISFIKIIVNFQMLYFVEQYDTLLSNPIIWNLSHKSIKISNSTPTNKTISALYFLLHSHAQCPLTLTQFRLKPRSLNINTTRKCPP